MNTVARDALRLFDDFERTDMDSANRTEAGFPFWNRSAWPDVVQMRAELEAWYSRYDAADAPRLRREFRSKRDPQHVGALFELFIHEHLLRAGFEVRCQVDVPGSANKPDFLALRNGVPAFYVEAKAKLPSAEEAALEQRRQEVLEAIRPMRSPDFFVSVVIYGAPAHSVEKASLRRALQSWLAGLNHAAEVARFAADLYAREAVHTWSIDGFVMEFRARPRTDSRGHDFGAFLASEMNGEARLERTDLQLQQAVEEKATRYADLGLPYLIAVDLLDFTTDSDDVSLGLSAAWGTPGAPMRTNVSGVLLGYVPNIAAAVKMVPWLVENPSAVRPLGAHASAFRAFAGRINHAVGSLGS